MILIFTAIVKVTFIILCTNLKGKNSTYHILDTQLFSLNHCEIQDSLKGSSLVTTKPNPCYPHY